jgi:hypothetical protein
MISLYCFSYVPRSLLWNQRQKGISRREAEDKLPDCPGTGLLRFALFAANFLERVIFIEQILYGVNGIVPSQTTCKILN